MGKKKKTYKILISAGTTPLGARRRSWDDNIKINLRNV
jgi:hypothetical protein